MAGDPQILYVKYKVLILGCSGCWWNLSGVEPCQRFGWDWSLQEVLGSQSLFAPLYSLDAKLPTYALLHASCHKFGLTTVPKTTKPKTTDRAPEIMSSMSLSTFMVVSLRSFSTVTETWLTGCSSSLSVEVTNSWTQCNRQERAYFGF